MWDVLLLYMWTVISVLLCCVFVHMQHSVKGLAPSGVSLARGDTSHCGIRVQPRSISISISIRRFDSASASQRRWKIGDRQDEPIRAMRRAREGDQGGSHHIAGRQAGSPRALGES
ncbi:unnamed protein product [Merluccius merluccius]